ncbi:MAG: efflux RND transporter periplasmic adaptor subunit [Veillonellales bacterium]
MQKFWKKYKGWIVFILLMAAAAAGVAAYYAKKGSTPVTAQNTTTVIRSDIQSTVSATGTISAVNTVEVGSRVTGLITEVRVKENDQVAAGQILFVLDDSTLRAQLAQYQAQVDNCAANYERSKRLAAVGAEAVQQLDTDRTNYLVAKSNYDNIASQLDYYVIRAPISGTVVGKPTPAGQTISQGISTPQVVMNIADMSKMQIKVQVDESDIGKVNAGQQVSFTVDAYPDKTFTGRVSSISRSATTSSNVVYYPVYVDVDSPEGLLYPTMTARVTLYVAQRNNVLTVPLTAVKEEQGQKYVTVMVNGIAQSMPVQTGLYDQEKVEILSGLQEGDEIVLSTAKAGTGTATKKNSSNQGPSHPPI